ncbi:MAG: glycoside hydrolase family 13 protein [Bacteroidales bacterium]
MKRNLTSVLLFSLMLPAMAFEVEKVDPPHWWTGMKNSQLQIAISGKDVGLVDFTVSGNNVKVDSCVKVDNKDYVFLYVDLKDAQPGNFQIDLKQGKQKKKIDYVLHQRKVSAEDRVGFDASDVLYLIMPDRFSNGDTKNDNHKMNRHTVQVDRNLPNGRHGGDLKGIENHLDYIQNLGVTAIWLNPVLENDQEGGDYHGYATTDYYRVDPRLGTNEDYVRLIQKSHDKGMKLVMDMIFNHCGSEHPWHLNPPTKDWFNFQDNYVQTSYRLTPHFDPYVTTYDKKLMDEGWFVESMPDLNQKNPHLMRYLIQNSKWWIEYAGIDGIRMDTHPYAFFGPMSDWCKEMNEEYPNFNIVGECWLGNEGGAAWWQKNSRLDENANSNLKTVMDFPLQGVVEKAFHENTDAWNGLNLVYDKLAMDFLYPSPNSVLTFLDNHDTDRFLRTMPTNLGSYKQALAFLLTTRGIPQIYYGTEILMNGTKAKSDGDIRLDFPGGWAGDPISAFTAAGRTPLQNEAFDFLKILLDWRKGAGNEVISKGSLKHFMPTNGVYAYIRSYNGKNVFVLMNGTDAEMNLDMTRYQEVLSPFKSGKDILTQKVCELGKTMDLSPREVLILELR